MTFDPRPERFGSSPDLLLQKRITLLSSVINVLNAEDVCYCLLSGYRQDSAEIDSDVDFMIHPRDAGRMPWLLQTASNRAGALLVQALQHETTACYFVIAQQEGSVVNYLNPDCTLDYRTHARLRLRATDVLSRRRRFSNFFLPAFDDEFIYYLIKKVLKAHIDPIHLLRLRTLYRASPSLCRTRITQFWSANWACSIERALLHLDLEWFKAHLKGLHQELESAQRAEAVPSRIANLSRDVVRMVQRVLRPTGLSVSIRGGESQQRATLADALVSLLRPAFRHAHWRSARDGRLTISKLLVAAARHRLSLICSTLTVATAENKECTLRHVQRARPNLRDQAERFLLPVDITFALTPGGAGGATWIGSLQRSRTVGAAVLLDSDMPLESMAAVAAKLVLECLAARVIKRCGLDRPPQSEPVQTNNKWVPAPDSSGAPEGN